VNHRAAIDLASVDKVVNKANDSHAAKHSDTCEFQVSYTITYDACG
jgi:hypothetical protein